MAGVRFGRGWLVFREEGILAVLRELRVGGTGGLNVFL